MRSPDHASCVLPAKFLDRTLDYQVTCTVCIAGERTITGTLRSQTQLRQSWKLALLSTPNTIEYCGIIEFHGHDICLFAHWWYLPDRVRWPTTTADPAKPTQYLPTASVA